MTLKEKFRPLVWFNSGSFNVPQNKEKDENSIKCERIADDYAIEFAKWCTYYRDKNRNVSGDMLHAKSKYDDTYTTKELLEIFKTEKGL